MARTIFRQTFIALRARRQACRIASDFLYDEPIDVETFPCRSCGRQMRVKIVGAAGLVRCRVCGARNTAPPHVRSRVPMRFPAEMRAPDTREKPAYDDGWSPLTWSVVSVLLAALVVCWFVVYLGWR